MELPRGRDVAGAQGDLEAARAAYERYAWQPARDGFLTVAAENGLAVDDLHALAQCYWWLGDTVMCDHHLEIAHRRYLEAERYADAADVALQLAIDHILRGDDPIGSGWMRRAARIAEELPEGPIHGYLTYALQVEANFGDGSAEAVVAAAHRVREIGHRFGDPTLVAAGLSGEGRMLIKRGRANEGLALLDEAMVGVVAGEVAPEWAGNLYCNTIAACHELGDFGRMSRWTNATERRLDTLPAAVLFAGICRVHRVQLHNLHGDWDEAERQASTVCHELRDLSVHNVAEAWYEIGDIRRRRGELALAEDAYEQAHAFGKDPQPGLALLRLAQGRPDVASSSIRAALVSVSQDRLHRAHLCAAQVSIATARGRPATALESCDELDAIAAMCSSPGLQAMAAIARGQTLLAEERPEEALTTLREACRIWRALDAPYDAARAGVLLARCYEALGDADTAGRELASSAEVFERLGATLDAAEVATLRPKGARPGGLSDREVEVLGLVADGRSNRQIAEQLFISQKTVARHLSNIFTKLGVGSRTEAARFAFDHGLLPRRSAE